MSDEIKVGDLVMVVRGLRCCGNSRKLGLAFTVAEIAYHDGNVRLECVHCGSKGQSDGTLAYPERGKGQGVFLYQLKKIDPPAQDESEETKRELVA